MAATSDNRYAVNAGEYVGPRVVRLHRRGNSVGVNIPKSIFATLGWRLGQHIILEAHGASLIFRPMPEVNHA